MKADFESRRGLQEKIFLEPVIKWAFILPAFLPGAGAIADKDVGIDL
jgi:hypothetical protein